MSKMFKVFRHNFILKNLLLGSSIYILTRFCTASPKALDGSTGACWFARWLASWWGACELRSWEAGEKVAWMGLGTRSDGCFNE